MNRFKGVLKLSNEEYEQLKTNGTLIVNGTTYVYSPKDTLYITPDKTEEKFEEINSKLEQKQDNLTAGENINIDENGVISAVGGGGLNIADLPKFTNKINIKMSVMPSLNGTITLPIVSSSNFVVDWGDGTTTDYAEAVTEISHTYSDYNFQGWIYIYGDWKGIQFTSSANNNKSVITKVFYDKNISSIETSSFNGCTSLNEINISNDNCSIRSYAFKDTALNPLILPKGLQSLSSYAFQSMKNLRELYLPSSLTYIDSYAFSGSYYLTELIIPDYVTTIGAYAFNSPQRLRYVQIGNTVYSSITSIGAKAFYSPNSRIERVVIKTLNTPSISSNTFADNVKVFLVNYSKLKDFKTATNWTNFADKIYAEGGNYSETITIQASSWDTATNTVTVEAVGATSEDRNIITWNVSSGGVQVENTYGLKCTAQGTMSLTFSCETIPTEDIEISVRYMLTNY